MNHQAMDWFERLTGFRESTGKGGYEQTRQSFELEGSSLRFGTDVEVLAPVDRRNRMKKALHVTLMRYV